MKNIKKICIILILFIFNIGNVQAQVKENDTISQIKEIRLNKDKYIGKPFAVLLADLKIKPALIISLSPANNRNVINTTTFYFRSDLNNYYIRIVWQDFITKKEVKGIEKTHKYKATNEGKNILKGYIVKDILTRY